MVEAFHQKRSQKSTVCSKVVSIELYCERDCLYFWGYCSALCRTGQMFYGVWFPFLLSPACSVLPRQLISLRPESLALRSDVLPRLVTGCGYALPSIKLHGVLPLSLLHSVVIFFPFKVALAKRLIPCKWYCSSSPTLHISVLPSTTYIMTQT